MIIHLVYEEEYVEQLKDILERAGHIVSEWDYSLSQFADYSERKQMSAEVAIVDGQAGVMAKKEIIEYLDKVRKNLPYLRIIIVFPPTLEKNETFIGKLLTLAIYDMYFKGEYDIDDLEAWLNKPKTYADYDIETKDIVGAVGDIERPKIQGVEETQESIGNFKSLLFRHFNLNEVPQDNSKILRSRTDSSKEKMMIGTVMISVAAMQHGSGATHTALSIANFLASKGNQVTVVELKKNNDYGLIYLPRKDSYSRYHFRYENFDIFANNGEITPDELLIEARSKNYQYIILDAGLLFKYDIKNGALDKPETQIKKFEKGDFYNDFMKSDFKIVNSFASTQYADSLEYFVNYLDAWNINDLNVLFSFANEKQVKSYDKLINSNIFLTPYNSSASLTDEQKEFYEGLLTNIMPKHEVKRGGFQAFFKNAINTISEKRGK